MGPLLRWLISLHDHRILASFSGIASCLFFSLSLSLSLFLLPSLLLKGSSASLLLVGTFLGSWTACCPSCPCCWLLNGGAHLQLHEVQRLLDVYVVRCSKFSLLSQSDGRLHTRASSSLSSTSPPTKRCLSVCLSVCS